MKVLVIYHRVDFDGMFSGAIVRKYYTESENAEVEFLGWNYSDELPNLETILGFDKIVMVDISFPPSFMQVLEKVGKCIWIDHHDSSIKASEANGYENFPGIRTNGIAACELTWAYYYPSVSCPTIIQYVGAYDVWNKERFNWEDITLPVQYALRTEFELKFKKLCNSFNDLIVNQKILKFFVSSGKNILKHLRNTWKGWIKAYGFPITVAGKYKGIAIIGPQFGSTQFESVSSEYDLYIVVERRSPNQYSLSMYKEGDRLPEFNCAEYLNKTFNNGGGHVSAAGTTIGLEDFIKLITQEEL